VWENVQADFLIREIMFARNVKFYIIIIKKFYMDIEFLNITFFYYKKVPLIVKNVNINQQIAQNVEITQY
jgi:hypothetical protein